MAMRRTLGWRGTIGLLLAIVAGAVLVACGGADDGATDEGPAATFTPDVESPLFTVNIDTTTDGFDPPSVQVPAGRSIQLILRNRDTVERHYLVVGLEPTEMLWLAGPEDMVWEEGISEEDHESHHAKGFVEWRGTSPSGIKPTLTEVHAYAIGGGVDVVHFYALTPGTYEVRDPLHPEVVGKLTVFAP